MDSGRVVAVKPNLVTGIIRQAYPEEGLAGLPHRPQKAAARVRKPSDLSFRRLKLGIIGKAIEGRTQPPT